MDNSKILMIYVIIVSLSNIIFKGNIRSRLNLSLIHILQENGGLPFFQV